MHKTTCEHCAESEGIRKGGAFLRPKPEGPTSNGCCASQCRRGGAADGCWGPWTRHTEPTRIIAAQAQVILDKRRTSRRHYVHDRCSVSGFGHRRPTNDRTAYPAPESAACRRGSTIAAANPTAAARQGPARSTAHRRADLRRGRQGACGRGFSGSARGASPVQARAAHGEQCRWRRRRGGTETERDADSRFSASHANQREMPAEPEYAEELAAANRGPGLGECRRVGVSGFAGCALEGNVGTGSGRFLPWGRLCPASEGRPGQYSTVWACKPRSTSTAERLASVYTAWGFTKLLRKYILLQLRWLPDATKSAQRTMFTLPRKALTSRRPIAMWGILSLATTSSRPRVCRTALPASPAREHRGRAMSTDAISNARDEKRWNRVRLFKLPIAVRPSPLFSP